MIYKKLSLADLEKSTIKLNDYAISYSESVFSVTGNTTFVYGLGERFNSVNQLGLDVLNRVEEQFCNQDKKTYFPLPFFILENNLGIYVNTKNVFVSKFRKDNIQISDLSKDTEIYILNGTYKEIIADFITITGEALIPPKWVFGPWMSGHRWNSEKLIREQLDKLTELELPITSLVIEQWSDEATFYTFNGAKYDVKEEGLKYEDYSYEDSAFWSNPKQMIEDIHKAGIKVLLWQAPMIKELEEHESENPQHSLDMKYVVDNDLVVKLNDSPYTIPKGNWFPGSMVPDFTNPETIKWWFNKRQYLFDIGIDGFKTDGGEFIHKLDTTFNNGDTGLEQTNNYSITFIEAYKNNISKDSALFSRAGYSGAQSNTILWAGDQKSTWEELRSQYNAGLSAALSGQHLWSFDIGGFAGELPSVELYMRATQLAVFTPIMQFHSEPVGGQFALLDPSKVMNNERSPWNIANHYDRQDILPHIKKLYWLRMNLIPYIYSETLKAIEAKSTVMKHMIVDYPNDPIAKHINHQHLLGDLLVVPVLKENTNQVEVYLPKGTWVNIFTDDVFIGEKNYTFDIEEYDMLVFIKEGNAILINNLSLFSKKDNKLADDKLNLLLYGNQGSTRILSEEYDYTVKWKDNIYEVSGLHPKQLVVNFI